MERLRSLALRYWIAAVVAIGFVPALLVGYAAMSHAYEEAAYEGYLVMVAAESCRPEAGFAGSFGGRLDVTAQMILRQNWRRDGEPCSEGERLAAFRTAPTNPAEYRAGLQRGCPETAEQREYLMEFGMDFDVFTYYFQAACEQADRSKHAFQWTIAGGALAVLVAGFLVRRADMAAERFPGVPR